MVKIRTMAAPTYIPASADRTRWASNERRWPSSFATAWTESVSIASLYTVSHSLVEGLSRQITHERFQHIHHSLNRHVIHDVGREYGRWSRFPADTHVSGIDDLAVGHPRAAALQANRR